MRSEEINGGHRHQACYDENGDLIKPGSVSNKAAMGTADRMTPDGHVEEDVDPFVRAAQIDGNPVVKTWGGLHLSHVLIILDSHVDDYLDRRPARTDETLDPHWD
jgi:hypothetical protein